MKGQLKIFEASAGGPSNRPLQSSRGADRGPLSASGPAGNLDTIPPEVFRLIQRSLNVRDQALLSIVSRRCLKWAASELNKNVIVDLERAVVLLSGKVSFRCIVRSIRSSGDTLSLTPLQNKWDLVRVPLRGIGCDPHDP